MWPERPDMPWALFNIYKDAKECQFHQSMWSERPDMPWDLFNTYKDANEC